MRRPSKNLSPKLSADSQRLSALARALMDAGSRLEERAWERSLDALVRKLFKTGHQQTVDAALDLLFLTDQEAYDALIQSVEACTIECSIEHEGKRHDALLIAVPVLAWTRFSIPSGAISPDMARALSAHLYAHVLASDARLAMAPALYSIDQLPRTHADALALTQRMAQAALSGTPLKPPAHPPETAPFLADTRFLLAAAVVPAEEPVFKWQQADAGTGLPPDRQTILRHWIAQAQPNIERLLPGCGVELLMPDAYYVACRNADTQIRPISIRAAVNYLTHTLGIEASSLSAIIGAFGDDAPDARIDEYRISFTLRRQPEVLYGVVWPLYGQEEAEEDQTDGLAARILQTGMPEDPQAAEPIDQIIAVLRACGIPDIKRHKERFSMEFCDDCGAPLFCDQEAELVHAEMPEDSEQAPSHLH